jgi:glutamyl-tRNA synthetase
LDHLGRSAAQFDEAKLKWVNQQHMKMLASDDLAKQVTPFLAKLGVSPDARLPAICQLFKDRCDTLVALAQWAQGFYQPAVPPSEELDKHLTTAAKEAIAQLVQVLSARPESEWDTVHLAADLKEVLSKTGLKMPQLAMPVRVLLLGTAQTPSLDAVLSLFRKEDVLKALSKA